MLVVTRKSGERLMIGEAVEISVLEIRGDQVRLGVSAPRDVPIHREELLERIRRENRRAAGLSSAHLQTMSERLRAGLPSNAKRTTDPSNEKPTTDNSKPVNEVS